MNKFILLIGLLLLTGCASKEEVLYCSAEVDEDGIYTTIEYNALYKNDKIDNSVHNMKLTTVDATDGLIELKDYFDDGYKDVSEADFATYNSKLITDTELLIDITIDYSKLSASEKLQLDDELVTETAESAKAGFEANEFNCTISAK